MQPACTPSLELKLPLPSASRARAWCSPPGSAGGGAPGGLKSGAGGRRAWLPAMGWCAIGGACQDVHVLVCGPVLPRSGM